MKMGGGAENGMIWFIRTSGAVELSWMDLLARRCFLLVLVPRQLLCSCSLLLWEPLQELIIDF